MIERRFDIPFVADLALREKQIQQNYRPVIAVHKWFARRPGTLFRALLLSEFVDHDLRSAYYRAHNLAGIRVADPFMGGGTPLLEANRVGCHILGADINPMAHWVVKEEVEHIDVRAYEEAASRLQGWLEGRVGRLYRTTCVECGSADAAAKYYLWVKTAVCPRCHGRVDLMPGYLVAEDRRHTANVFVCAACGNLTETADRRHPGACASCDSPLAVHGPASRGRCACPKCGISIRFPDAAQGAPSHRLFAIEYHCPMCAPRRRGRFFKRPDERDLALYGDAERELSELDTQYVPDDAIPPGDETDRLHRWGYRQYRQMFNARQLLGLELSCRALRNQPTVRIRNALATNLSDLLRYQNMLCRYDTMALKSLDIFSVHGFPVGLVQCESNLLGIVGDKGQAVGSGGWLNISTKYSRAKRYCNEPFEVSHRGGRKTVVPVRGEWIGESQNGSAPDQQRGIDLRCAPSGELRLEPNSLDAVFTDPPYFANVQYAELMDFCYVWLRRLVGSESPAFAKVSTRDPSELTGNVSEDRGLEHFTAGLSDVFTKMAAALKRGSPLAFTYHHNDIDAYMPAVVALLDAHLACTAAIPCPAEMGASIHINGTASSIVDTVFVCRTTGAVLRRSLQWDPDGIAGLVSEDIRSLCSAGMRPTAGDIRCVAFGHVARMAVWSLRKSWSASLPTGEKLDLARGAVEGLGGWKAIERSLGGVLAEASPIQLWELAEDRAPYGGDDEVQF